MGFAHSRLAIIDLSTGGHQPMAAASGAGWVTYNGELYNYKALRQELVEQGCHLRSGSDTEVLVEHLGRDGIQALGRLRGMFAFAWWDERSGRLLLARDNLFEFGTQGFNRLHAFLLSHIYLDRNLLSQGGLGLRKKCQNTTMIRQNTKRIHPG